MHVKLLLEHHDPNRDTGDVWGGLVVVGPKVAVGGAKPLVKAMLQRVEVGLVAQVPAWVLEFTEVSNNTLEVCNVLLRFSCTHHSYQLPCSLIVSQIL